jgi:triosephosphate isomerase
MKHIFVNLKRFDVPAEFGGVNRAAPVSDWARAIIDGVKGGLAGYTDAARFTFFFPEAHIIQAAAAAKNSCVTIGCQGVYHEDVAAGGNFGAFTAQRPAAAARALGCEAAIIGHCEERKALSAILAEGGASGDALSLAANRILAREIKAVRARFLSVLYCVGEAGGERERWQDVLEAQIEGGLSGLSADELRGVVIGYEPVWAIGPGKTPPGSAVIEETARFIKDKTSGLPVVYGGGLKKDNAAMLAGIAEIDGGLIALTRFSGEIGFYPEEYLEIVRLYLEGA